MYQPKSVLLPVYNGEKFLTHQITSILCELKEDDELILFIDGSKDRSMDISRGFSRSDERVKVHSSQTNIGLRNAINFLILKANHAQIVFVDQDDEWLPGRLDNIQKLLTIYDCVIVNALVCGEDLKPTGLKYFDLVKPTDNFVIMLLSCRVLGCCMAFNKDALNGLNEVPYGCWHDHFLILWMLLLRKNIYFHSEPLVLYRRHSGTLSLAGSNSNKLKRIPKILLGRFFLVFGLVKSIVLNSIFKKV